MPSLRYECRDWTLGSKIVTRMRRWLAILAVGALLIANSAEAQAPEEWDQWGKTLGDRLVRFLPNAATLDMSVDPHPPFRTFANETYAYKGADSMVYKYPSYIIHQTWWLNDPELAQQMTEFSQGKRRREASVRQGFRRILQDSRRGNESLGKGSPGTSGGSGKAAS